MRNEGSHPCVASLPICQKTFINTEPGLGKDVMSPFLPGKGTRKTKRGRAPCNLSGRANAVLPPAEAGPAEPPPPPAPRKANRRSGGSVITPLKHASIQTMHPVQNHTPSPRRGAVVFQVFTFLFCLLFFVCLFICLLFWLV